MVQLQLLVDTSPNYILILGRNSHGKDTDVCDRLSTSPLPSWDVYLLIPRTYKYSYTFYSKKGLFRCNKVKDIEIERLS